MTFGAFISAKRKEARLNLRDAARHLGIAYGYLCDIEQGRRPAPEGKFVDRISSFLSLSKEEHEQLLDLAADSRQTVPADLPDYIRKHDIVRAALRVAKEVDAIKDNDQSFFDHEIQLSGMIGSQDGAYENFREFVDTLNTPENIVFAQMEKEDLYRAVSALSAADQALIQGLFFEDMTEREYAERIGVFRNAVHEQKVRSIKKLRKFLKK